MLAHGQDDFNANKFLNKGQVHKTNFSEQWCSNPRPQDRSTYLTNCAATTQSAKNSNFNRN
jgi:hypothetical protein